MIVRPWSSYTQRFDKLNDKVITRVLDIRVVATVLPVLEGIEQTDHGLVSRAINMLKIIIHIILL